MRRLCAAGAGALASCLIVLLLFAFSAPSANAAHPDDLAERIAEPQLGITRQWFSPGKTTLYIDHSVYKNFNVSEILSVVDGKMTPWRNLVETEVRRWGFGVERAVDASSLLLCLLCAQAHFYDPTIMGSACEGPDCAFDPMKLPAASWQGFVGARTSSEGDT